MPPTEIRHFWVRKTTITTTITAPQALTRRRELLTVESRFARGKVRLIAFLRSFN